MQARLTRKLMAMVLGGALSTAIPAVADADDAATLQGTEQAAYLDGLKRLYLTDNERNALLAHSNALLETYALRAAYQVGQAQRQDLLYRFNIGNAGELILREESRGAQGTAISVRNQRVPVFGIDPFIRYECPTGGIRCVLFNPADGSPLLSIVRDEATRWSEGNRGARVRTDNRTLQQVVKNLRGLSHAEARSLAHSPLFQSTLSWDSSVGPQLALGELTLEGVAGPGEVAKFDLTLTLGEVNGVIRGTLNYATALFDASTIVRYIGYFERLLEAMIASDQVVLESVPLLAAD